MLYVLERSEIRTRSSSCACQPSCALSGGTSPGLSVGPAVDGLLTASLPAASLGMSPFAHTNSKYIRGRRGGGWGGSERLAVRLALAAL